MLVPGHCLPQTWISRVQTLPGFHFLCSVFTNCILRTAVSEAVLQWWKGINLVSWPCDQSLLIFMQNSSSNIVSTSWFLNITSRKFPRDFPEGPVGRLCAFTAEGLGSIPDLETKVLKATQNSWKKKFPQLSFRVTHYEEFTNSTHTRLLRIYLY